MRRVVSLILLLLSLGKFTALAQGGSNYSALGIGDLRYNVGALYDAMSGTSIAMPMEHGINVVNPALLGLATTTRIQTGYRFNQHVSKSEGITSAQNNGKLDGLIAMFSVDTARGFGFSLGILPYSSLNYSTARNVETILNGKVIRGRSIQLGKGGVSQIQLASSVKLYSDLQIGISGSALFGILEYSDQVVVGQDIWSASSTRSYDIRGLIFKGGIWWRPVKGFNIGTFVSAGTNADVFITRRANGVNPGGVYADTVQIENSSTGLPVTAGVGWSMRTGKNLLGMDFMWGDYTGVTANARPDARYSSMYRSSIGFSHPGEMGSISTFIDNIGYHTGAYFEKLYVTLNGVNLYEYAGSFGISFPLGGHAMIDAAVQAGWRGPGTGSTLTDLFGKLNVTVSIGETWFKPFVRE